MRPAVVLLTIINCAIAFAQTPVPLTPNDIKAAEVEYSNEISAKLKVLHQTLSDQPPSFPDGARGYSVEDRFEVGTSPFSGDREDDSRLLLGEEACNSQLVAVVQAGSGPQSYLISDGQGIITAYGFTTIRVLKGKAGADTTVTVVGFGGEVVQNGIKLRVATPRHANIRPGDEYLLFLHKNPQYPSNAYFLLGYSYSHLRNNEIVPSPRKSDEIISNPMHAGETVDDFVTRMNKAIETAQTKGACH